MCRCYCQGPSSKLFAIALLATMTEISQAQSDLSIDELDKRMLQAERSLGSFAGTETVTKTHVGVPPPDLSVPFIAGDSPEGDYRWFVRGEDWWMVKTIHLPPSPDKAVGSERFVVRNYGNRVLSYSDYEDERSRHSVVIAHLDQNHYQAPLGPFAGRWWNKGPIREMLREMTDVHLSRSATGVEVAGRYHRMDLRLTISPQRAYLTTALTVSNANFRTGFSIPSTIRIGENWMPRTIDFFGGTYSGGELQKGATGHVEFTDVKPHGPPTSDEVPPIPAGMMLASEEGRIYRVARDGTLVDFGTQGFKPGTPLAWGSVFVLSGAGLLLTSLSVLVFRKRRAAPAC